VTVSPTRPPSLDRVGSANAVAGGSTALAHQEGHVPRPGSHVSAQGVALARRIGESLGPFAYVVTSASPRAMETAVAMGFAVDDTVELPSGYVAGEVEHHEQWGWPRPYRTYAELLARPSGIATVAEAHRRIWARVVEAVPDGAAALVVGHGGGIEPGLVACLPDADHESWGAPLAHCDGARLSVGSGRGGQSRGASEWWGSARSRRASWSLATSWSSHADSGHLPPQPPAPG
jgi:broad specificity phosphatase PhoE